MPWWKRESMHERLAREGGLLEPAQAAHDPLRGWDEVGIHGVARPRRWDTVAAVEADDLPGDEVRFVALPDGSLVVEEDVPDDSLTPLADVIEATLEPPYRAEAIRRGERRWAVGARAIEVAELPDDVEGQELELAVQGDEHTLLVDGERAFGSVPALERLAGQRHADYVVRAARLDGRLWEVRIAPL